MFNKSMPEPRFSLRTDEEENAGWRKDLMLFETHFLDLDHQFTTLDSGSLVAAQKAPLWLGDPSDIRGLVTLTQANWAAFPVSLERQMLVEKLKERILSIAPQSATSVPIADIPVGFLLDETLAPIYNDIIVIDYTHLYMLSLMTWYVHSHTIPKDRVREIELAAGVSFQDHFLLVISGNIRRSLIYESAVGYVHMMVDTGRLEERLLAWANSHPLRLTPVEQPHLIVCLNRCLGFSGYFYSALRIMTGELGDRNA